MMTFVGRAALAGLLAIPMMTAHAQTLKPAPDSPLGKMQADRLRQAATQKQQKMLDDADKLLAMAQQLKVSVDKTSRDELSLSVVKQADEIEKLAKQVKDRMKQ